MYFWLIGYEVICCYRYMYMYMIYVYVVYVVWLIGYEVICCYTCVCSVGCLANWLWSDLLHAYLWTCLMYVVLRITRMCTYLLHTYMSLHSTDLVEARVTGIIDLLDEECKLPKCSNQHFTEMLHQTHQKHFRLTVRTYVRTYVTMHLCFPCSSCVRGFLKLTKSCSHF